MSNLSIIDFGSNGIRFEKRGERVWVNLTDMAKASGKRIDNWKVNATTIEFLTALENSLESQVVLSIEGNTPSSGTWAIEEVAIEFAGWCSVQFKIWMLTQIKTLLSEGIVSIKQQLPQNYLEALKALVEKEEILQSTLKLLAEEQLVKDRAVKSAKNLYTKIQQDKPAVDFANDILFSDGCVSFLEFAKMIGTGRTRLFTSMREANVIMLNSTLPYQRWIDAGYFKVSEKLIQGQRPDGSCYDYIRPFAVITGKGQRWLHQRLSNYKQELELVDFAKTVDMEYDF